MNQLAKLWSQSKNLSDEQKQLVNNLSEEQIDELFNPEFKFTFGTSGVRLQRNIGTKYFNKITYMQLIVGFIEYLNNQNKTNKRVVFGRDNRFLSKEAMQMAAELFSASGYEVLVPADYKMLSTPIISYLIHHTNACGGIMFTASHNPKEYCGFKVYGSNGAQPLKEETDIISDYIPSFESMLDYSWEANQELIKFIDDETISSYFKVIEKALVNTDPNQTKELKVVFSAHHGSSSYDMIPFLNSLGYKNVISVSEQNQEDPNFSYDTTSNPEVPISFKLSLEYAQKHNANLMLSSDPDGDRLGAAVFKNGEWVYLTGNETAIIAAYYLLKHKSYDKAKYVISTYISTRYIELFANEFNCEVKYVDVGFKNHGNLIAQLKKTNSLVIGFEEAIGALWNDFNNDKDSYQYAALLLEIVNYYQSNHNMDLIDILEKEIFPKYGYWYNRTIQFIIDGDNWKQKAISIMNNLKDFEFKAISDYQIHDMIYHEVGNYLEWKLDGLGSIKFRLSGTEPKFKVYIELYIATSETDFDYKSYFSSKVADIIDFLKDYTGLN